ncbi:hypothetical protein [Lactobacillus lindneri] [Lactiplantibacillus mudanjiangensis]|uniref:helix-turn-helix transcriptional regulator n=1 Tax=Lactiplantibacillus mudanjiangensis TaxID=1296538 RepID=UPI00101406D5|nr:hypothetical protein [Lactobacillus lindneri] [Lactiplantibacillus mudanjiangensis]
MVVELTLKDSAQLRKDIALNGYSIRGYARSIKISEPYLSAIINEQRTPSPRTAGKIADGLNQKIDDIFFAASVHKSNTAV